MELVDYKPVIKPTLLLDAGKLLKPKFRKEWSENNHTRGYCYLLSEVLYHYFPNYINYTPRMVYVGNETHWYLQNDETGEIADFTAQQYGLPIPYYMGIKRAFFKGAIETERGYISRNGYKLHKLMKNFYHGQN